MSSTSSGKVNDSSKTAVLGVIMPKTVNSMGPDTFQIPTDLYRLNRSRLLKELNTFKRSAVLLQGGDEINHYDTEDRYRFKQESFFMWLFGVNEPGCYGVLDTNTKDSYLFMPKPLDPSTAWRDPSFSLKYYQEKYDVDFIYYTDSLSVTLARIDPITILTLGGCHNESGIPFKEPTFPGRDILLLESSTLYPIMAELRVFKTCFEYEVMKYVLDLSTTALKRVMRTAKPGKSEYLCESEFMNYIFGAGGCRFASHNPVCASGKNTACLNYGDALTPNENYIRHGDLCLLDMGACYFGYCANITTTFPASGKFTADQRAIYEGVLDASRSVIRQCKPGVSWGDMHLLAMRTLLQHLQKVNIIHGNLSDMLDAGLGSVFQPHGIGHLIGLDRFDVGGYGGDTPRRLTADASLRHLRTLRTLKEGMFFCVRAGCYFIDELLNRALRDPNLSKYMVHESVNHFRGFGGIRIEDVIYVHAMGCVNMTKMPRSVEHVEDWLAGIDCDENPYQPTKRVSSVRFFT